MKLKLLFFFVVFFSSLQTNAQSFNPTFNISSPNASDTFVGGYTFSYATAGTPWNGALMSFGGFSNQYDCQISTDYGPNGGNHISYRTRNGDISQWNSWNELATRGVNTFNGNQIINGNVGIGTATPSANLEIYKNLSTSTLKISNSDPSSLNTELRLGGNNTFEKSAIISAPNPAGWWRQDLYFCLANGNNTNSTTISDAAMVIKSYNSGQFGYVGIGTTNPDEKLTVKGKIHAQEVRVDLQGACAPDYVFQKYYTGKSELKSDYVMPTLAEIESFTKKNHHLPNVPSAQEAQQNGVSLGTMSNVLLQKVEELTLYAIEQQKKLEVQNKIMETQSKILEALTTRLNSLEKK